MCLKEKDGNMAEADTLRGYTVRSCCFPVSLISARALEDGMLLGIPDVMSW